MAWCLVSLWAARNRHDVATVGRGASQADWLDRFDLMMMTGRVRRRRRGRQISRSRLRRYWLNGRWRHDFLGGMAGRAQRHVENSRKKKRRGGPVVDGEQKLGTGAPMTACLLTRVAARFAPEGGEHDAREPSQGDVEDQP